MALQELEKSNHIFEQHNSTHTCIVCGLKFTKIRTLIIMNIKFSNHFPTCEEYIMNQALE